MLARAYCFLTYMCVCARACVYIRVRLCDVESRSVVFLSICVRSAVSCIYLGKRMKVKLFGHFFFSLLL